MSTQSCLFSLEPLKGQPEWRLGHQGGLLYPIPSGQSHVVRFVLLQQNLVCGHSSAPSMVIYRTHYEETETSRAAVVAQEVERAIH